MAPPSVPNPGLALRTDERLDLLRWVAAPERATYLAILEVFDAAKASYDVQLRPTDVHTALTARGEGADAEEHLLEDLEPWFAFLPHADGNGP